MPAIGLPSYSGQTSGLYGNATTRGRIAGGLAGGLSYPSPFFDIAHTYLPESVSKMFKFCRYYFFTQPIINAIIFKLSEYAVTDLIFEHDDPKIVSLWTEFYNDQLQYRRTQVEYGLDYHTYGNSFSSPSFPFIKYLICSVCKHKATAESLYKSWVYQNHAFKLTCPKCKSVEPAHVEDIYPKDPHRSRRVRWNPEDMNLDDNEITGESTYYYNPPAHFRNDIIAGKKAFVSKIPQVFLASAKINSPVRFNEHMLFHMKRATLANKDRGWGFPLLLPLLKDAFYLTIMQKAQEQILLEHLVPLRVMFPQPGSGSSDPYTSVNLVEWKEHVGVEIARWRRVPSYIPILPLPVGNQTFGGDGKSLMLTPEMAQVIDKITWGAGVPREFVQGGLSYSGSSVSMRMLENAFIGYLTQQKQHARWTMDLVATHLGWPKANLRFKRFKLADDIQRKAYRVQLNQLGVISKTTLAADDDIDLKTENVHKMREAREDLEITKNQQLTQAEAAGEAMLVTTKYQVKAQQAQQTAATAPPAPGEAGGAEQGAAPGGQGGQSAEPIPQAEGQDPMAATQSQLGVNAQPGLDISKMAFMQAQQISQMPPSSQATAIQNLEATNPELGGMVRQILASMGVKVPSAQAAAGVPGVDMRPLPEQRPPRRTNSPV